MLSPIEFYILRCLKKDRLEDLPEWAFREIVKLRILFFIILMIIFVELSLWLIL